MSEFINNVSLRRDELYAFSVGIFNGGKRKEFIEKYQDAIDNLTPADVFYLVHELTKKGRCKMAPDRACKKSEFCHQGFRDFPLE